jgi:phospholipid/cholesterol/gamma-HCH transport system substrate-binding protein
MVLASTVTLILLIIVMTGRSLREKRRTMYVSLPAAPGLVKGDAVLLRGVAVGEVRGLNFGQDSLVIVDILLTDPVTLTSNTSARLVPIDIFGRQSLVLSLGLPGGAVLAAGDTICGEAPPGMATKLDELTDRAERILGDTTRTLIHAVLSGGELVARDLDALLLHADRVLGTGSRQLDSVLRSAAQLSANLASASDSVDLRSIQSNLEIATANLAQLTNRMDSASATLALVVARLERGEGTAGLALKDPRLYENATAAMARLESLLADIRANPRRYVSIRIF